MQTLKKAIIELGQREPIDEKKFLAISLPFKIRGIEVMANVMSRFIDQQTLSRFVPEEGKTEEISIEFELGGNPTLANLFTPKQH